MLLIALALALAGCGGGSSAETTAPATTAPATTTSPADPGHAAIEAFAAAAHSGNADSLWRLLSTSSKKRFGPTLERFRKGTASELTEGLGSIEDFQTIVSERITPEFGVVAIDGTQAGKRAVYAVALRLEGKQWKFELGGPVKVRPIGPDPDAHESVVAQVAAAVQGSGGAGTAVMFANFEPALDPGGTSATAWAFTVAKK